MGEWIEHDGQSIPPVHDNTVVEFESVNGMFYKRRAYAAIWGSVVRYRVVEDDDITTESTELTEPTEPTQWPPEGMAIQVWYRDSWRPAVSAGDGWFRLRLDGLMHELEGCTWHYWPAPPVWPEWARVWLALSSAEYAFGRQERQAGAAFGAGVHILHVEHRPEGV